MTRLNRPTQLLLTAVIVGVTLRAGLAVSKKTVTHDEMISYLGASANLGAYHQVINGAWPNGTWVAAAEWKHFITPGTPYNFNQIGWDQADNDIHPPLYFWLLHLWILAVGVHPWTGASLNIFFFAIGLFFLYKFARDSLGNDLEAAAAVMIWSVSPAVLAMSSQARHYELFGLSTIIFIWLFRQYMDPAQQPIWPLWLLLVVATAVGTLTHFHFALVVCGAVLIFFVKSQRTMPLRLLGSITAILGGYGMMLLLHPHLLLSIRELVGRQVTEARYLSTGIDMMRRVYALGDTFTRFWIYGRVLQTIIFIFALASLIWLALLFLKRRTYFAKHYQKVTATGQDSLLLFLWLSGWTILLYLTFITPIHAMKPRHMAAIWPFYALLPVFVTRLWPQRQKQLLLTICGVVLVSGILSTRHTILSNQQMPDNTAVLAQANAVIIDTVKRGIAPRLYWPIPDNTPVFIAPQTELAIMEPDWIDQLPNGTIYINDLSYDNDVNGRDQILAGLARRFEPVPVPGGVWGWGNIYLLREK